MNDFGGAAIDYKKLLKEEKKKARLKLQQQQQQQQQNTTSHHQQQQTPNNSNSNNDITVASPTPLNHLLLNEEDIEAIDFTKLKQEERQKAAQWQREKVAQKIQDEHNRKIANQWTTFATFHKTQHTVCNNPPTIYYVSDFFSKEQDQTALIQWLQSLPDLPYQPQQEQQEDGWTALPYAKRRVAVFDSNNNTPRNFPPMIQHLAHILVQQGIFTSQQPPNHVLVNEYHAGQGIMPHTDGPAYLSRTATLSLGSSVMIQFTPRPNYNNNKNVNGNDPIQVLLEPGSLVVFEDAAYLDCCHSIDDRVESDTVSEHCVNAYQANDITKGGKVPRGYRISLTFRHKFQSNTPS